MLENDVPLENLRLAIDDAQGRELVAFQPARPRNTPMPKPVEKPKAPKDYATSDELYFTGQRIEQLYSPSFEAAPYYEEMLRRDPGDYQANTAIGILLCKQWRWDEAAKHLSNAIGRATANHIRPKDGEAFYYLGVALRAQGKLDAAYTQLPEGCLVGGLAGCERLRTGRNRPVAAQLLSSPGPCRPRPRCGRPQREGAEPQGRHSAKTGPARRGGAARGCNPGH